MYKLAPSILAADFTNLGKAVKSVEEAGAHYLHIDVMDGHFVPNISMGPGVVKDIRKITDMTLDVHLMLEEPGKYIKNFIDAGADIISIHVESNVNLEEAITIIKSFNKRVSFVVKPNTNIEKIYPYLDMLDMALIMSVEPGFGGQKIMYETLKKAEKLANYAQKNNVMLDIEMDGGIDLDNVKDVISSGVNIVVAGSSVFNSNNIYETVRSFYNQFK